MLVPQSEFRNAACSLHRICLSLPPGLLQGVQGRMKRQTLQRINKNERVFSLNCEGYVKEFLTKREKIVHLRPQKCACLKAAAPCWPCFEAAACVQEKDAGAV